MLKYIHEQIFCSMSFTNTGRNVDTKSKEFSFAIKDKNNCQAQNSVFTYYGDKVN